MTVITPPVTVEEYFEIDEASDVPVEYWGGTPVAMSGENFHHALIKANLTRLLQDARPTCRTLPSSLRVEASGLGRAEYAYPDVLMICSEPEFDSTTNPPTLRNPTLIAEILSPSTRARDLDEKLHAYLTLDSLVAYLIVDTDRLRVRICTRDAKAIRIEPVEGLEATVRIPALDLHFDLKPLYDGVLTQS